MTLGLVLVGVMAAAGVARVVFLNSEITTLSAASAKFLAISQAGPNSAGVVPIEVEEAHIEYEWLKNTTDLKKETRLIWILGTVTLLFVLGLALII